MKAFAFFISTSLFSFSFLINVVLTQDIVNTCSNWYLSGSTLHYTCNDENGNRKTSQLDLNLCITNNNGYLEVSSKLVYPNTVLNAVVVWYILKYIPLYSGQYSSTCSQCQLEGPNSLQLTCTCWNNNFVNQISSMVDLGQFSNTLDIP